MIKLGAVAVALALLCWIVSAGPAGAAWTSASPGSARVGATTVAPPGTVSASCDLLLNASVKLQWGATASAWADGYEARWGTTPGGPYPNTSGVVTGLAYATPSLPAGTHYLVVRAAKGSWRSANTTQVSKTVISVLFVGLVCV